MAHRGVHFALSDDDVSRLRAIESSEQLVAFITEEIEETYFEESREWVYETDKAWDAIHRCLGDGTLLYGTGPFPLSYAILRGNTEFPVKDDFDYVWSNLEGFGSS
ncbi:MAG: DUF1877 family protein [Myxococcota bacterium]